ncbi:MAG: type II toxin-antitoxin system VapC family toxin [Dermatophilaceae bacterium]
MAGIARLDTHVVVWLYTGEVERLSRAATEVVADHDLVVSPMVQLELTYLHEIGRLTVGGAEVVGDLAKRLPLTVSAQSFDAVVSAAAGLTWTRDPFDRLIVADCLAASSRLVTKDEMIAAHTQVAVW